MLLLLLPEHRAHIDSVYHPINCLSGSLLKPFLFNVLFNRVDFEIDRFAIRAADSLFQIPNHILQLVQPRHHGIRPLCFDHHIVKRQGVLELVPAAYLVIKVEPIAHVLLAHAGRPRDQLHDGQHRGLGRAERRLFVFVHVSSCS